MATNDSRLLDGIIEQANKRAQQNISEAQKSAELILADASARAERQVESLRRELAQRLKLIQMRHETSKASARRRAILAEVDQRYQAVMERVLTLLDAKTVAKHLPQWIAEATLGLDLTEAKVASSREAAVKEEHLRQAEQLIADRTGMKVTLHVDKRSISGLGVIVSSMDDSVSFNNQVEIRLRRFDRTIRSLIQENA
ncbi:MAG: ATPase [Sphaerochaeta sp.]|jgi:V/A-type H+-transporting ATPase subunit E